MNETYKSAGVSIEAGDETVQKIKGLARSTFSKNVLSGIGLFGGFYELEKQAYNQPVLVSSVDGVGTKLKIAFQTNIHNTIGQCLVNHCVNDIGVCGAEPLFFLDYVAFGKLIPEKAAEIIAGISKACKENGCALIGGETAEMPGFYSEGEYDISGTIVGIVEKEEIINGKNIREGDVLIGFASNGLHTNGYSLARKVLFPKYRTEDRIDGLEGSLGEELLRVHKSYLPLLRVIKATKVIQGLSHITGGGIVGNTKRIIPEGLALHIDWNAWTMPELFRFIQKTGSIREEEMRSVFNIGIGLVAVVREHDANEVLSRAKTVDGTGVILGRVIKA